MDNRERYKIISTGSISLSATAKSDELSLSERQLKIIDEVWDEEYERSGGRLFNGSMLVYASHEIVSGCVRIRTFFSEYKLFLAGIRRADIGYRLIPVGVSGLVICREADGDYALFAKRAETTSMYQGFYELVPAGTIDRKAMLPGGEIDYKGKLLEELEEEIGGDFEKSEADSVEDLAFVLDAKENVYDVCCVITVSGQKENIVRCMRDSDEYRSAEFIPISELDSFIEKNIDIMIPTSAAIAEAYRNRR